MLELAEMSGLGATLLQDIENGNVLPSKIQMENLAACPKLGLSYETLAQWKEAELKHHWQELGLDSTQSEKWVCPFRRWDCPCCNWPFTLKCDFTGAVKQAKADISTNHQ